MPVRDDDLTALERLSKIQDLVDMHEFMQDEHFAEALELTLKCIAQPALPPAAAKKAIVLMQSWGFVLRIKGQKYMTINPGRAGTGENMKKNTYFTASDQCDKMAQTLKYLLKENY